MNPEKPIKLSAALPKEAALNGLHTVHAQVARHGQAYVIASTIAPEVVERTGGVRQPKLVIERIEGLPSGELAKAAKQLMDWARAEREGNEQDAMISKRDLLATIRNTSGTSDDED